MIRDSRRAPLIGAVCRWLYGLRSRRLRQFVRWVLDRCEGGSMFSLSLRRIFARHHGIAVGEYTHGGWMIPFHVDAGTTIGRYCSIAEGARILTHNHPLQTRSTSGLFFEPWFGVTKERLITHTPLVIGNDVWIGHNAVVLPSVRSIGNGAVIGAGAIVGRDVPPYAIVHGNPARVVGYRFGPDRIAELLAERWWERDLCELGGDLRRFQEPLPSEADTPAPTGA